jgi:ABC-type nitrate/sulfonate/bicarbonate transport system permease component
MQQGQRKDRGRLWFITAAFVALVLLAWELASRRDAAPAYFLGPVSIASTAIERWLHGDVAGPAWRSASRAYAGFLIGGAIGVALGLLSGISRQVRGLLDVPQAFVHAIPKISLFPAVAVWLGFSDASRVLIIALSCFFPAYLNAMNGALGINPRYLWLSRNIGVGPVRTFLHVVFPASLVRTMVGLRISLMVAFILMVATEVAGHSDGLGSMIMLAYQDGDYRLMYAGILVIAVMGYLSNAVLERCAGWACRGQNLEFAG